MRHHSERKTAVFDVCILDRRYLRRISCKLSLRYVLILEFEPPEYNVRFYEFPNGSKSDLHCLLVSDVLQFFIHWVFRPSRRSNTYADLPSTDIRSLVLFRPRFPFALSGQSADSTL